MTTADVIEAQLMADLNRLSAWFVERDAGETLRQFSTYENQQAGALNYIVDVLVRDFGHERATLTAERGWGFIVDATKVKS